MALSTSQLVLCIFQFNSHGLYRSPSPSGPSSQVQTVQVSPQAQETPCRCSKYLNFVDMGFPVLFILQEKVPAVYSPCRVLPLVHCLSHLSLSLLCKVPVEFCLLFNVAIRRVVLVASISGPLLSNHLRGNVVISCLLLNVV